MFLYRQARRPKSDFRQGVLGSSMHSFRTVISHSVLRNCPGQSGEYTASIESLMESHQLGFVESSMCDYAEPRQVSLSAINPQA